MPLWILLSFGLFGGSFCAKNPRTRRTCLTLLTGWMLFSMCLLLLGNPAGAWHD